MQLPTADDEAVVTVRSDPAEGSQNELGNAASGGLSAASEVTLPFNLWCEQPAK